MASILTVTLNPSVDIFSEADTVRPVRKIRTSHERRDPGGGGVNVARMLLELGQAADALLLAGGTMGMLLDDLLKRENISGRIVPSAQETRIAFTVFERSSQLDYRFVSGGFATDEKELEACFSAVEEHSGEYVVASGSLPEGAPADTYARIAEISRKRGARFLLDSSGDGLRVALEKARPFLIKPSVGELEQLVGRKLDENGIRAAALEIVERGSAELVAVTMGSQGALLASADGAVRIGTPRVTARSAVGAGDSFLAGMLWALQENWALADALRLGAAAGAATVMMPGTQLGKREDILALYRALAEAAEMS